jgi:hypothetical protein
MKVYEILKEEDGGSTAGQGGNLKKQNKSGKVHDHYQSAIKGMETYTDNNTYYTMYRFGVDMARGTKEHYHYDPTSPVGNQMATVAYTDAEQKIIDNSKKNLGLKSRKLTSSNSSEHPETHTASPVAKIKRNKYGV